MTAVAAGIYCRISLASDGDTTKTDDQERICRELAERKGWRVADIYTDHARSAWQPSRKRPQWERMLADVEAGKISAIVVYHGDRLLRTHEDLLKLINLARTRGIKLASPAGERDLGNPDDQFILEIEASMAKRESANTSRRRKAQYERWRRDGRVRPGGRGGRAFGFDTKGEVIEAEAALIRRAAQMILDGHTTGDVGRWLTSQGAVTPAGNAEWGHGTVRQMLARPRYAGLMPDGVSKAAWDPVIDRDDWEQVCAVLKTRAGGFAYATNRARYLLSGIATCGRDGCGGPMQIWQSKGRSGGYQVGYRCSRCKRGFRSQPLLDGYVSRRVVNVLNRDDNPQPDAPQLPGLAAEFATLTKSHAELRERYVADPSHRHAELMLRRLDRIEERITQLRDHTSDTARLRLIRAHRGITMEQWHALPLAVRRSLVAALFTVVVLPASRRGPGFNPRDVRMTRL